MYQVTEDYLTALQSNARAHTLSGTVNGTHFTGADVIRNSFTLSNQICEATKISLGGVFIGKLDLTFTSRFAQAMNIRGAWKGKEIKAYIGVELDDGSFERIPVNGGTYIIESAQWVDEGIKITAFDYMSKFDNPLSSELTSGTAYDFLTYACRNCRVELGMTQEECKALTNGEAIVFPSSDNSMETYRDLISNIALMCACYATITRDSKLILKPLPAYTQKTLTIPATLRYSTSFSDFSSYYTMLEVTNNDGSTSQYSNQNIGGLAMEVDNPFLESGLEEYYTAVRKNIINKLQDFRATPFSASLLPNPALDLGDQIEFIGGIGQGSLGCIMSITHKLDCTIIDGFGENPTTSGVNSAISKKVAAQARSTRDEVITHIFSNVSKIHLGEDREETIIEINFATVTSKTVKMLHEIILDLDITSASGIATCTAYYYLNDDLVDYEPITSWNNSGYHLLHLIYGTKEIFPNTAYKWVVKLKISGGTAFIDRNSIRAILEGQGLSATDEFDGILRFNDVFVLDQNRGKGFGFTDAGITFQAIIPEKITTSDHFVLDQNRAKSLAYFDRMELITQTGIFNLITEDGRLITTEDGSPYLTDGGGH